MSDQSVATVATVGVETPLHYFTRDLKSGENEEKQPSLALREKCDRAYLNLRGNPSSDDFQQAVQAVLGVALPLAPNSCGHGESCAVFWLGPDEWMLVIDAGEPVGIEARLRDGMSGHFSLVDVSSGFTTLELKGSGVMTVLKKSSGYDFDGDGIDPSRCVQTTLAKASALVYRPTEEHVELIIRRSFSDYLALWLLDAGGEFNASFCA